MRALQQSISTLVSEKLLNLGVIRIDWSKPTGVVPGNVIEIHLGSDGVRNEIGVETIIGFDELPVALSTVRNPALEDFVCWKVVVLHVKIREIALRNDFGVPMTVIRKRLSACAGSEMAYCAFSSAARVSPALRIVSLLFIQTKHGDISRQLSQSYMFSYCVPMGCVRACIVSYKTLP